MRLIYIKYPFSGLADLLVTLFLSFLMSSSEPGNVSLLATRPPPAIQVAVLELRNLPHLLLPHLNLVKVICCCCHLYHCCHCHQDHCNCCHLHCWCRCDFYNCCCHCQKFCCSCHQRHHHYCCHLDNMHLFLQVTTSVARRLSNSEVKLAMSCLTFQSLIDISYTLFSPSGDLGSDDLKHPWAILFFGSTQ